MAGEFVSSSENAGFKFWSIGAPTNETSSSYDFSSNKASGLGGALNNIGKYPE